MIILEKPYVSELLEQTLLEKQYPVLQNLSIEEMNLPLNLNYWNESYAAKQFKNNKDLLLYSNSENSIKWIAQNLSFTDYPQKIELFKDKVKFRQLISEIYPDFYFEEIEAENLSKIDISQLKIPFIIKPSVGFLSMGVYPVHNVGEWEEVLSSIFSDMEKMKSDFPIEVIDSSKFIIEEIIEGDEFAIDVYFDKNGHPVILNILQHPFSSGKDVSDRVYFTSKEIIQKNLVQFETILAKIGNTAQLKNFPIHIELRTNGDTIIPIEINPMRFAGWCTTDIAYYAYGINPYEYYFEQKTPNWDEVLEQKDDSLYYLAIADIPSDIAKNTIDSFDYEGFSKNISQLLAMREIDFKNHPLFAMVFGQTKNYDEISDLLELNLSKYTKLL